MERTNKVLVFWLVIVLLITSLGVIGCKDSGEDATEAKVVPTEVATQEPTSALVAETPTQPMEMVNDETLVTYTEQREPCDCRNENKNLYFGDLHAHTRLSFDAYVYVRAQPLPRPMSSPKGAKWLWPHWTRKATEHESSNSHGRWISRP